MNRNKYFSEPHNGLIWLGRKSKNKLKYYELYDNSMNVVQAFRIIKC